MCACVVTRTQLQHTDHVCVSTVCGGYRLQASQGQDSMKVVYYVERDLAQFHPTKGASHPCKNVYAVSVYCV